MVTGPRSHRAAQEKEQESRARPWRWRERAAPGFASALAGGAGGVRLSPRVASPMLNFAVCQLGITSSRSEGNINWLFSYLKKENMKVPR